MLIFLCKCLVFCEPTIPALDIERGPLGGGQVDCLGFHFASRGGLACSTLHAAQLFKLFPPTPSNFDQIKSLLVTLLSYIKN